MIYLRPGCSAFLRPALAPDLHSVWLLRHFATGDQHSSDRGWVAAIPSDGFYSLNMYYIPRWASVLCIFARWDTLCS